jgi:quercetin dioxygenase-like cupin family protein
MKTISISIPIALAALFAAAPAGAQGAAASAAHKTMAPDDIQWGDAPPVLPKGAKLAVLYGDPSKDGLFIVRLKLPAGYQIAPHTHPTDENVTVIAGSFAVGMGDKLDPNAKAMPAGAFFSMPAKMHHFAIAKKESIVEVSAMGPLVINYINPADDPSKAATSK